MFFELWLDNRGYTKAKLRQMKKAEKKELYQKFKEEMAPVVRECTNWLNETLKTTVKEEDKTCSF